MARKKNNAPAQALEEIRSKLLSEYTDELRVDLTEREIDNLKTKCCELLRDISQLELEKKSAAAAFKSRLDDHRNKLWQHSLAALRGWTEKDIALQDWLVGSGEVETIRVDTGEVVRTRTAKLHELQDGLPGIGDVPAPGPAVVEDEPADDGGVPFGDEASP